MTLLASLKESLEDAGLNPSTSAYQTYALNFWNRAKDDLSSRNRWTWLRTKSSTFDTVASQRNYSLASDVLYPIAFYHKDDDFRVRVVTPEHTYEIDPGDDTTGRGDAVAIAGLDSSGNWEIEFSNIPDTAGDTYFYSYQARIANKTSSNYNTSLDSEFPLHIQQTLGHYVTSRLMVLFGGHDVDSEKEMEMYEKRIAMAMKNQANLKGNQRTRMIRRNSKMSPAATPVVNWPISS